MKKSKETHSAEQKYAAPALDKGLDVLELFVRDDQAMSMSEIARKLERSNSEIFRMVITLQRRGYLHFDQETEKFSFTQKMFRLAHTQLPIQQLNSASAELMRKLAKVCFQSCHLVIPYRSTGLIVVQEDSQTDRCFRVRLGAEISLADTCSGNILLAHMPGADRRDTLASLVSSNALKDSELNKLQSLLDEVRTLPVYRKESANTEGVIDLGAPIFGFGNQICGALTIPFLRRLNGPQTDIDSVAELLSACAIEISNRMGAKFD